jgi:four helix bundle protein
MSEAYLRRKSEIGNRKSAGFWPGLRGNGAANHASHARFGDMQKKHVDLGPVGDLKDLVVWQVAVDTAVDVYRYSTRFPAEERFGLQLQLRKAAVSVASNIAEGHGRVLPGDYARCVRVARGELKEVETQVIIGGRLGFLESVHATELLEDTRRINQLMTGLLRSLRNG